MRVARPGWWIAKARLVEPVPEEVVESEAAQLGARATRLHQVPKVRHVHENSELELRAQVEQSRARWHAAHARAAGRPRRCPDAIQKGLHERGGCCVHQPRELQESETPRLAPTAERVVGRPHLPVNQRRRAACSGGGRKKRHGVDQERSAHRDRLEVEDCAVRLR